MNSKNIIKLISRVSIFGGLAIILYMVPGLQFSIFPGLSFLKIHFDEIPVLIASLAYGPFTGFLIMLLKSLFKLIQDIPSTGGIGVLADFLYGLALILPASIIYKKYRTFKGGLIAIFAGLFINLLVSSFLGYYIIFPLYGYYFNINATSYSEALDFVFNAFFKPIDESLNNQFDIMICFKYLLPFNLIKDGLVVGVSLICYKSLSRLLKKLT